MIGFDDVIALYFDLTEPRHKELKKSPDIQKKFHYKEGSSKAYIVISPCPGRWHLDDILVSRILKKGYSVLKVHPLHEYVSPNIRKFKEYFVSISKVIEQEVAVLKKEYDIKEFGVIGVSLSWIPSIITGSIIKEIKDIVLVAPGFSLANVCWEGLRAKSLKKEIIKQGLNYDDVKKEFKDLYPSDWVSRLRSKNVFIYISKADKVMPYDDGIKLVELLKQNGCNLVVMNNRYLGHYLTDVKFYFFSRDFLTKKVK